MSAFDDAWLAEQAQAASNELIERYGWRVDGTTKDGMDQDTVVRMMVAVGWVEGFKAGEAATS